MKIAELEAHSLLVNRTGIMTNPELSVELIQAAQEAAPTSQGGGAGIASNRADYVDAAPPIGSRPLMVGEEEAEAAEEADLPILESLPVLLDKLGERLAFERQGARLYEALMQKCERLQKDGGGPSVQDLRHIYEEEVEHFKLLQRVITQLGGDATVQTPSADVAGVLSQGILQIVSDPRTTMAQTLQAMLNAELADNDGWRMLAALSSALGQSDLEAQFDRALSEEEKHLENVRSWLESMTLKEANALPSDAAPEDEAGGRSESGGPEQTGKKTRRRPGRDKRSGSKTNRRKKR